MQAPLRILHLEDDPRDVELIQELLSSEGLDCEVVSANSRASFHSALELGSFDLIMADNSVLGFNGLSALALSRDLAPDTPFIFVSGTLGEEVAIEALRNGATDYVLKHRLARLAPVVRRALYESQERIRRKQTEVALQVSEIRYRRLFETAKDGILLLDFETGQIIDVNPFLTEMLDYTHAELLGKTLWEIGTFKDVAASQAAFLELQTQDYIHYEHLPLKSKNGQRIDVEFVSNVYPIDNGAQVIQCNIRDITERKRAEAALQQAEARYRNIYENSVEGIYQTTPDGHVLSVNPALARILGYDSPAEMIASISDLAHQYYVEPEIRQHFQQIIDEKGEVHSFEYQAYRKDGTKLWVSDNARAVRGADGALLYFEGFITDITERKYAEEELQRRNRELNRLYHASDVLLSSATPDFASLAQTIVATVLQEFGQSNCSLFILEATTQLLDRVAVAGPYTADVGHIDLTLSGQGAVPKAVHTGQIINVPDVCNHPNYLPSWREARSELAIPLKLGTQVIGAIDLQSAKPAAFSPNDERLLTTFAERAGLALENARLFNETGRRLAELEAMNKVSTTLRAAQTLNDMLPILLEETLAVIGTEAGLIWLYDETHAELQVAAVRGWFTPTAPGPIQPNEGLPGHVFTTGAAYLSREFAPDPCMRESERWQIPAGWGGACIPIRSVHEILGVLVVAVRLPRELTENELRLLTTLTEMAGNAIHRTRLHEQTEQQLQRLAALHTIDIAIGASLDLHFTLDIVLEQVTAQLAVDAADVLLLNSANQTLEYAAGRGFRGSGITQSRLRLGEGHAGRAALERQVIVIPHLGQAALTTTRTRLLAGEKFVTYYVVPLIAKGQVKGVLEIFHRQPLLHNPEWMNFLETLAGQTAIAVENASLFEGLQRSNVDLALAYDTTLEGWSRALDLRDRETEGHTERVTRMTERLARALGVGEAELVHVRRGALLHDIGKMGIPDGILLKPGPLMEEERSIMQKHPVYAHELLKPIPFLHPALDIPYCHHEKWDGTGYPRGLKGEAIPLSARIFAVVDVWDALRSDRPYRAGWPENKVREHLRSLAGTHFDPQVVKVFLRMLNSTGTWDDD